jgi:hypothetical protein
MPAAGELRVAVRVCGVCRTDLHVLEGELPPQRRLLVPGHQVCRRSITSATCSRNARCAASPPTPAATVPSCSRSPRRFRCARTRASSLADANQALVALKHDGFEGAAVLRVAAA